MAAFVTGIAPTQDVAELEKILGGISGLDRTKFVVITTEEPTGEHEDSFLDFVHADDEMYTGDDSSNVPDISKSEPTLKGYLSHPHFVRHVGNLPIPDDEADNYNDAIEDGRAVVAYPADGNTAQVEAGFKAAGLAHVKTFQSR